MPQEARKGTSDAPAANPATDTPPDNESAQIDENRKDPKFEFTRAYVEELRAENKEARLMASKADYLLTEVRRLAIKEACRGVLTDPEALAWDDTFQTEDGLPDHAALKAAAEALATAKPWLSRPRGDVGQGQHGTGDEALSLSALLRG